MKNVMVYIIIFFLMCSIGNYSIDYTLGRKIENQSQYHLALASIGADLAEARMDCWAQSDAFISLDQMAPKAKQLIDNLGFEVDENRMLKTVDGEENTLKYAVKKGNNTYRITIKSNRKYNVTYYALSFSTTDEKDGFQAHAQKLKEMPGMKWKIYFLNTGIIDGIISDDSKNTIIDIILDKFKAERLETFADGRVISVTANSDLIQRSNPCIMAENGKYNMQVAIRVNEVERKTYILIGNPLILGNY